MTAENRVLLDNFFSGWRCRDGEKKLDITGYFMKAEKLVTLDRVKMFDDNAARTIAECQEAIAQLTAYRLSLTERYNQLSTSPSIPVVKLVRERHYYDKKVYYYLRTFRRLLLDGTEIMESSTQYAGSDRKKALSDFQDYCKAHPGITAEKDIEKAAWEK